ncbi:MAG: dTDP-6-deoxy-L-hexose 3-O-methyltransferase, partial [uncultured Thermoleophilia bacterium]
GERRHHHPAQLLRRRAGPARRVRRPVPVEPDPRRRAPRQSRPLPEPAGALPRPVHARDVPARAPGARDRGRVRRPLGSEPGPLLGLPRHVRAVQLHAADRRLRHLRGLPVRRPEGRLARRRRGRRVRRHGGLRGAPDAGARLPREREPARPSDEVRARQGRRDRHRAALPGGPPRDDHRARLPRLRPLRADAGGARGDPAVHHAGHGDRLRRAELPRLPGGDRGAAGGLRARPPPDRPLAAQPHDVVPRRRL